MNFLGKAIIFVFINSFALFFAGKVIPGFSVPLDIKELLIAGAVLTALSLLVRPIVKLILLPLVWITFGLADFAISGLMLVVLDNISEKVIISGLVPLILGTLLISITSGICRHLLLPKS